MYDDNGKKDCPTIEKSNTGEAPTETNNNSSELLSSFSDRVPSPRPLQVPVKLVSRPIWQVLVIRLPKIS
jgi:hypothetical protein